MYLKIKNRKNWSKLSVLPVYSFTITRLTWLWICFSTEANGKHRHITCSQNWIQFESANLCYPYVYWWDQIGNPAIEFRITDRINKACIFVLYVFIFLFPACEWRLAVKPSIHKTVHTVHVCLSSTVTLYILTHHTVLTANSSHTSLSNLWVRTYTSSYSQDTYSVLTSHLPPLMLVITFIFIQTINTMLTLFIPAFRWHSYLKQFTLKVGCVKKTHPTINICNVFGPKGIHAERSCWSWERKEYCL